MSGAPHPSDEAMRALVDRLGEATCAIYCQVGDRVPSFEGSGVLVEVDGKIVVFTAAHVLDALEEEKTEGIVLAVGGDMIRFPTTVVRSRKPGTGRAADRRDFAVFPVPSDAVRKYGGKPVSVDAIDLDPEPCEESHYVLVGLPATRQATMARDGELHGRIYSFMVTALPSEVEKESGTVVNLDLKFDREDLIVDGERRTAPSLRGMSGGGAWRVRIAESGPVAKLSGILIEHDQRRADRRARTTRPRLHLEATQEARRQAAMRRFFDPDDRGE